MSNRRVKLSYCADIVNILNKQRFDRKHCDFVMEVNGEFIYAHKAILSAASPYFEAIFEHDVKENVEGKVQFTDAEADDLKTIIDYIYGGKIKIDEDTVQSFLFISGLLQIDCIKEQCRVNKLFQYLENCALIKGNEFLTLSFKEVKTIIEDGDLYVEFEEKAYESVFKWVKHDPAARQKLLQELMSHVLLLIDGSTDVTDNACKVYDVSSNKVFDIPLMAETREELSTVSLNGLVYAIGGSDRSTAECYERIKQHWSHIATMRVHRYDHGVCAYNGHIYVIDGCGDEALEEYNPITN
uniref:BTB domain-containing protein n=1 Tax=Glossina brevipalpis TaxID=37001 RepID=A0A1A9W148_9MUSC